MTTDERWNPRFEPRRWQEEAFEAWKPTTRGIVRVVTGGGKTALALMCIAHFHQTHRNARSIIVVPTLALLDQWYTTLIDDLSVPERDIAIYSGEEKSAQPAAICLVVLNTARTMSKVLAQDTDAFLVVDECHRIGSPVNALALDVPVSAALGLSATPERPYDDSLAERIVPALGPIIYEYGYEDALADGVIAPFRLVNVAVDMLADEEQQFAALTRRISRIAHQPTLDDEARERMRRLLIARAAVAANASMRIPVAARLVELNRGRRTLVFHERITAAETIAATLGKRGHAVTLYHSKISGPLRRSNLRLYRKGAFDVLVTCRALDEGLNVPETEIAVIASSTASTRQRIQRLGRVLRRTATKDSAVVYTIYASEMEKERLTQEADALSDISSTTWLRAQVDRDMRE